MNKKLLIGFLAILLSAGVAVATVSNLHTANGTFTGSTANSSTTYVDIASPPANLGSDGDFYYQLDQPITQSGATLYYHMAGVWVLIGHIDHRKRAHFCTFDIMLIERTHLIHACFALPRN